MSLYRDMVISTNRANFLVINTLKLRFPKIFQPEQIVHIQKFLATSIGMCSSECSLKSVLYWIVFTLQPINQQNPMIFACRCWCRMSQNNHGHIPLILASIIRPNSATNYPNIWCASICWTSNPATAHRCRVISFKIPGTSATMMTSYLLKSKDECIDSPTASISTDY